MVSIEIVAQRVEQVELQKFKKLGIVSLNMPRSCGNNKKKLLRHCGCHKVNVIKKT